jgi:hypothetical protein
VKFKQKQLSLVIAWIYAPIFGMLVIAGLQNKAPISVLVRDIFATADIPSYTGFFSNLGVMVWCMTATVCFFTILILRNQIKKSIRNFLIYAGSLSVMFMLDDFFLLHERYYSRIVHETKVYLIYLIMLAVFLLTFRRIIIQSEFIFLILTILFWGFSVGLDAIESILYNNPDLTPQLFYLVEDGSKLLGIVSWAIYTSRFCLKELQTYIVKPKVMLKREKENKLTYSLHHKPDIEF